MASDSATGEIPEVRIDRIDHVYITVSDLARAEGFYDKLMQALGFRKGIRPIGGEPHVHYFNAHMQYTIRPAHTDAPVDAYRTGALHHICFQVADREAVDLAYRRLRAVGVEPSEPKLYTEYRLDYYAIFFTDPDGIRLEIVCDTGLRRLIRSHWHELSEFVDPVASFRKRHPELAAAAEAMSELRQASGGNVYRGAEPPAAGERHERITKIKNVTIERIASSALLEPREYDQECDEWVVLLRGHARLEIAGELVDLAVGDYVVLPSHTRHRVLETTADALWLAIYVD
jgi:catechol 2,3-dioxygenase-like lactoylglutathione lyase family enzyme/mannose-6-phosphate isomerase-like protein (cupin superfamily)